MSLILASASPRRSELLRAAGYDFVVRVADVDEAVRTGESPDSYVRRVIATNLVLIGCGWAAENGWPILGLIGAGAAVLLLLAWMMSARSGAE